jgi:hypothetical protein
MTAFSKAHPCTGSLSSLQLGASHPCTGLQAKANNESECESDSGLSSLRYDKPGAPPQKGAAPAPPSEGRGTNRDKTRPPRCEQSLVDGSLLWSGEPTEDEAGVLADLGALAAAGLGEWVEEPR